MIRTKTIQSKQIKLDFILKKHNDPVIFSFIALILAIIGWGLSGTFISLGLKNITSLPFLSLRFLTSTILITPIILFVNQKNLINLLKNKWIWSIALFETLGLTFQYIGLETVSAGLGTLISLLFVVIVPILAIKFLNEKFTSFQFIGTIGALIGVVLIASNGNIASLFTNINFGMIILLWSAFFYSFYLLASSKYMRQINPDNNPLTVFYVVTLLVALFATTFTFSFSSFESIPQSSWFWIILLAIISTIIPFIGYFIAIKYISANIVTLLLLMQVLIPLLIDVLFLGVFYGTSVIIGGFLILIAMIIGIWKSSKP
ncbi:MAG: hypothetical protein HeimC3_03480 [Candidatus Heimdallarchaeota archaeon LC_3]|nr:MAG: hypothetical protein HeimC3_03480 [Candidatus Heimdallarchaeota archaeon LC_3]